MKEKDLLISLLKRVYESGAWHGPPVKEIINGVGFQDIHKRVNESHSIIELVAHMISWRNFVIKKLQGENDYEVDDEKNFPRVSDWTSIISELEVSQEQLIDAIEQFPDTKLGEKVPNRDYDYLTLLHGIVHHDIYHTGQVQLIKKAR